MNKHVSIIMLCLCGITALSAAPRQVPSQGPAQSAASIGVTEQVSSRSQDDVTSQEDATEDTGYSFTDFYNSARSFIRTHWLMSSTIGALGYLSALCFDARIRNPLIQLGHAAPATTIATLVLGALGYFAYAG